MEKKVFEKICRIVYEKSGIALNSSKEALVEARLAKRMRALGIVDFKGYLDRVLDDGSGMEIVHLLDAISTNVTSFFREPEHFDFLGKIVPAWLARGQRRLRFWSAASSSGEEPYSLAMTLLEVLGERRADLRILATDLSTHALGRAREGIYDRKSMRSVPPVLRGRYFQRHGEGEEARFEVRPALKGLILFRRLNLSAPPFPLRGPFDAILCRNVMIYFDDRLKVDLFTEFYRLLRTGGFLLVGHAESLSALEGEFKSVEPSIFVKAPRGPEARGGATA